MHMGTIHPPSERRVARLLATVALCERGAIEDAVEGLIALLDARDGDIDLEDSEAGETCIDDRGRRRDYHSLDQHRPADDDDAGDGAWQEWDSRDPRARRRGLYEPVGAPGGHEDDEEDDDDTACDDVPIDGDTDREAGSWCEQAERASGILQVWDDDGEDDAPELRRRHRNRVRATRCVVVMWQGRRTYRLRYQAGSSRGAA